MTKSERNYSRRRRSGSGLGQPAINVRTEEMIAPQRQTGRSPRVLRTHLPAYARRIYVTTFRAGIGIGRELPSHPVLTPRMRFLFVGPAFCLRLPPDSTSRWTPLPSS